MSNPEISTITQSLCWKVKKEVLKGANNGNAEPFPINMSKDMWDITAAKDITPKK